MDSLYSDVLGILLSYLDMESKLALANLCLKLRRSVANMLVREVHNWDSFIDEGREDDDVDETLNLFENDLDEPPPPKTEFSLEKKKNLKQMVHLMSFILTDPEQEFQESTIHEHLLVFPLASQFGLHELVRKLFDARANPTTHNNYSIRKASEFGHCSVVKFLLQLPGVDPTSEDNTPLCRACENGHSGVVRLLLEHPRVNPSVRSDFPIRSAAKGGHTEIVRILLTRVNPNANNFSALTWACTCGNVDVMRLLVEYPGFDPAARWNYAIQWASRTGHLGMVKFLVECPGVDPSVNNNYSVYWANRNGYKDVVKFLLGREGVEIVEWKGVEPGNPPQSK